jgi:hypothetical protein
MQLDISAEEAHVLVELLERALRDTREEVYKAEVADYKVLLKRREAIVVQLLGRLRTHPAIT